jgi:hypothetical protein
MKPILPMIDINQIVRSEFGFIADKFETVQFCAGQKPSVENPYRPGVYVFLMNGRIWKVGKHNSNAYKRCLEHFEDDTGSNINKGMKQFQRDENMQIMLFLLKNESDLHWIYALECYLEMYFRKKGLLEIHSARL